jgi:hypothetical protein
MADLNFSALGVEAFASARQSTSGDISEAVARPDLFDFASILGGILGTQLTFLAKTPELSDESQSSDPTQVSSAKGAGEMRSGFLSPDDIGQTIPTLAVSEERSMLGQVRSSGEYVPPNLSNQSVFPTESVVDPSGRSELVHQNLATGGNVQSTAEVDASVPDYMVTISGTTAADDQASRSTPSVEDALGKVGTAGRFLFRGNFGRQDSVAEPFAHVVGTAKLHSSPVTDSGALEIRKVALDRFRPNVTVSARGHDQGVSNMSFQALGDNASDGSNLEAFAVSHPPSATLVGLALSFATPTGAPASPTRGRLPANSELRVTAELNSQATAPPSESARTMSIGELRGVAGKLQFQNESLRTPSPSGVDSLLPLVQGGQLHAPLPPGPDSIQQQAIAVPVSSPDWPNAFSSSIVRLASEQITEANLTVTPDDLGTINIKVSLEGNRVSLGFAAENGEVREAVNASLPILQDMLEQSGLSLGQSNVGHGAQRNPNSTQYPLAEAKSPLPQSAAAGVVPAASLRLQRPQLASGRVDFFA